MIEFLTLFLGIVAGSQSVTVVVDEQVAAVELRLDGVALASATEAPWEFQVDLGTDLLPHELEAVAFDSARREIARAVQRLNVPRASAEVSLVLRRGPGGFEEARIAWESTSGAEPVERVALLDQEEVPIIDGDRIDLRGIDNEQLHILQAELWFPDRTSARGHLVFGGQYVDETNAELTALPVASSSKSLAPTEMNRWFFAAAEPLRVVAVEKGLASLLVVRSPGVGRGIQYLAGQPQANPQGQSSALGPIFGRAVASSDDRRRTALPFHDDLRIRLVAPRALKEFGRQVDFDLFSVSPEIRSRQGGIYWLLGQEIEVGGTTSQTRVTDAVSLAGVLAAATDHRRAVLLVLADGWEDSSRFSVATVRGYLDALNVPLIVWQLGETGSPASDWGPSDQIANYGDLKRAWRSVEKILSRQRVVWLEGIHLPNRLRIAQEAGVDPVNVRP